MYGRYHWISRVIIGVVLCGLFWGWSSCTTAQQMAGKKKQTRYYTTLARQEIQATMDGYLENAMRSDAGNLLAFRVQDPCDLSELCVDHFFKEPIAVRNMYDPREPVWRRGPAGQVPGMVYLESTRSPKGLVIITGVYLDPETKGLKTWVEKVQHDREFGPRLTALTSASPGPIGSPSLGAPSPAETP